MVQRSCQRQRPARMKTRDWTLMVAARNRTHGTGEAAPLDASINQKLGK